MKKVEEDPRRATEGCEEGGNNQSPRMLAVELEARLARHISVDLGVLRRRGGVA